jgi:ABC-2 type transport system permease protein
MNRFPVLLNAGLRALTRSATVWVIAAAIFTVVNLAFWPSLEGSRALDELGNLSDDMLDAFGAGAIATPAGYLDGQLFALMLPVLLSAMVITHVTALTSGDEDAGRLELLQALPVTRRTLWLSRYTSSLILLIGVAAAVAGLVAVLLPLFSFEGVAVTRVALATLACTELAALHGSVAFAAGGIGVPRSRAVTIAVSVLVIGYVLDFVVPIAAPLRWARRLSPWWWTIGRQPVTDGIHVTGLLLVLVVGGALVLGALRVLDHRDLRGA